MATQIDSSHLFPFGLFSYCCCHSLTMDLVYFGVAFSQFLLVTSRRWRPKLSKGDWTGTAKCWQINCPAPGRPKTQREIKISHLTKHCTQQPTSLSNHLLQQLSNANSIGESPPTATRTFSPCQPTLYTPNMLSHPQNLEFQMAAPMAYSPFAFEHDLNIVFRKALTTQPSPDTGAYIGGHISMIAEDHRAPSSYSRKPDMECTQTPSTSPSTPTSNTTTEPSSSPATSPSTTTNSTPTSPTYRTPLHTTHKHTCSICALTFRLAGDLTKHWYRKHERRFACTAPGCSAAFHLNADLARHVKCRHSESTGRVVFQCDYSGCQKAFSRKDNMLRHITEEHEHGGRKRKRKKGEE